MKKDLRKMKVVCLLGIISIALVIIEDIKHLYFRNSINYLKEREKCTIIMFKPIK